MKKDISFLIKNMQRLIKKHELAPGAYARWTIDDGSNRNMGVNEYGCGKKLILRPVYGERALQIRIPDRFTNIWQDLFTICLI